MARIRQSPTSANTAARSTRTRKDVNGLPRRQLSRDVDAMTATVEATLGNQVDIGQRLQAILDGMHNVGVSLEMYRHLWQDYCCMEGRVSEIETHPRHEQVASELMKIFNCQYAQKSVTNKNMLGHVRALMSPKFVWHEDLPGLRYYAIFGADGLTRRFLFQLRALASMRQSMSDDSGGEKQLGRALTFAEAFSFMREARDRRRGNEGRGKGHVRGTSLESLWQPNDCATAIKMARDQLKMEESKWQTRRWTKSKASQKAPATSQSCTDNEDEEEETAREDAEAHDENHTSDGEGRPTSLERKTERERRDSALPECDTEQGRKGDDLPLPDQSSFMETDTQPVPADEAEQEEDNNNNDQAEAGDDGDDLSLMPDDGAPEGGIPAGETRFPVPGGTPRRHENEIERSDFDFAEESLPLLPLPIPPPPPPLADFPPSTTQQHPPFPFPIPPPTETQPKATPTDSAADSVTSTSETTMRSLKRPASEALASRPRAWQPRAPGSVSHFKTQHLEPNIHDQSGKQYVQLAQPFLAAFAPTYTIFDSVNMHAATAPAIDDSGRNDGTRAAFITVYDYDARAADYVILQPWPVDDEQPTHSASQSAVRWLCAEVQCNESAENSVVVHSSYSGLTESMCTRLRTALSDAVPHDRATQIRNIPFAAYRIQSFAALDDTGCQDPTDFVKCIATAVCLVTACEASQHLCAWAWIGAMSVIHSNSSRMTDFHNAIELPPMRRSESQDQNQDSHNSLDTVTAALALIRTEINCQRENDIALRQHEAQLELIRRCVDSTGYYTSPVDSKTINDCEKKMAMYKGNLESLTSDDEDYEETKQKYEKYEKRMTDAKRGAKITKALRDLELWANTSIGAAQKEEKLIRKHRNHMTSQITDLLQMLRIDDEKR
ncbi:hypothetical protein AC578_4103 [Pseudocercospora eumusae]|uniref:Uncharacterized protein n=1 Tax=Pseudocercospora eumusae TaxID=321146 RepID=A0A139HF77_9PEZI|nr:hypothetical protein AC578_4103 [Pseudocercospora eumusae]